MILTNNMKEWYIDWGNHRDYFPSLPKLNEFLAENGLIFDEKFIYQGGKIVGKILKIGLDSQ